MSDYDAIVIGAGMGGLTAGALLAKRGRKVLDCATPLDFERRLLLPEGAIYALQQDLPAQAMFRPSAKSKSIQGPYLTGSSTHPGGGVPSVIGSGVTAAKLIEQNEG